MKILSGSLTILVHMWTVGKAMQVALLDDDSCKWLFIQKAKLLTSVCREHSSYLKSLLKNLISGFMNFSCKG